MKTLSTLLLTAILAASATSTALAQQHQHDEGKDGQLADMMADPESQAMMMDTDAHHPEMQHQMMKEMMQSKQTDSKMDMHKMMNDPEMRARMQQHMEMMQTMLNSEGMSHEEMQEMMNKPEMKSMMEMHMMCSKMMDGGMMDKHSSH